MVGRMSDVVASVQIQSAQQKPARSQAPKDTPASDDFGSLVDSNTQAISNNAPAQDTPARRNEQTSSSPAPERPSRDSSSTDQPSQSKASDDTDPSAPVENDRAEASSDPAKDAGKVKEKSETADAKSADKSDETESKTSDGTELVTAAVDAAAAAPPDVTLTALPDPGIIVAAPVVPLDPNAAANQAGDAAAAPLAIAAAALAASASTAAQIAGTKTDTATTSDKSAKASAKAAGAEIDADTTTTLGEAATGTTETTSTDAKAGGGLIAAVSQGTPKTAFKDAATAQAQTDVSNIGQDTGKANLATAQAPANAAHAQGFKPQADNVATEAKAGPADRAADPAQGTPAAPAHAGPQATIAPTDTSAQAASAVQAPLTNTTSAATASTATLTATAATHNAAVPVSGIPIEIAAAIRAGKSRFDISLDPAELGRIDVRINVDRAGNVTSHLTVEKPETLQMLRQDAPQLQRALDDAGFKTGSNGLSFSLRDQNSSGQHSGQNNDNGGNARRLIVSEDDSVPAAPIGRGYGRMLGSSSGVDIRV
ncbi:flagellar hook-length control protein FliK [Bradyrhizobium sp. CCBAU 11357]|uniref:flagellar hook-length control protein FliK n=1 Tax=Bradyrhizobium sp. CCBAU 11357 TaxID=1630808 RepID=UPI002304BD04|nr:flagellar hook-length control protein FliK [Bradyrhizobium sp. CCBAU 11357]MDA9498016.1 flagellar hook-length control protein [Bradyrhizobium sp. CCBAU 11357]